MLNQDWGLFCQKEDEMTFQLIELKQPNSKEKE